jgi:hypothetical protein
VPFTLSHAAAAFPFRRTPLDLSALITGCFTPDFAYFILLKPHGYIGHKLPGIFLFDLPLGLLALWLFHAYMKQPLMIYLPCGMRRRMQANSAPYLFRPAKRFALIVLSVLIGTATHIAWDSFTHDYFWPYRHWSFLRLPVHLPVAGTIQIYKLLQHGSTLIGLVAVALWIRHWYRTTKPAEAFSPDRFTPAQRRIIILLVPALALCCAILRAFLGVGVPTGIRNLFQFAGEFGIASISFFCIGILLCGVAFRRNFIAHPQS